MDDEIPSRHVPRSGPYNMLHQQDLSDSFNPTYQDSGIAPNKEFQHALPLKAQSSMTITLDQVPLHKPKLPPKAFYPLPRTMRVRRHIQIAAAAFLSTGVFVAIIFITYYGPGSSNTIYNQGETYCTALALANREHENNSWLNINTAFGKLTFTQARVADLSWDIIVSRCGQGLLGWITYRVYTAVLLLIMEERHVSYELYSAITLSNANITTIVPLVKAIFTNLGWRRNLLLFWLVLSVIWVAAWPLLTNAMTGYVNRSDSLIKVSGGAVYANYTDMANTDTLGFRFYNFSTSHDASNPGTTYALGPVLLNSGPDTPSWNTLNTVLSQRKGLEGLLLAFPNTTITPTYTVAASVFYYYQGVEYDPSYFNEASNVQCIASGSYQWGFSLNVALCFGVLNLIWTIITYAIWMHMNRKSELCRKGRTLGKYRAVVDMAEAIENSLGKDICAYSEEEISDELGARRGVRYVVEERAERSAGVGHVGLSEQGDGESVRMRFREPYGRLRTNEIVTV